MRQRVQPHAVTPLASISSNPLWGIWLRLSGVAAFAAMMALLKFGMSHGAAMSDVLFYRNASAMPVILLWVWRLGGFSVVRTPRVKAHMLRGGLGFMVMCCTFAALDLLPLAQATAIGFLAPIFATLMAALLLKEAVRPIQGAALLAGFAGILIIAQPGAATAHGLGLVIALIAAFGTAAVSLLLREIGKVESAITTVFWFTIFSTAVTSIPYFLWRSPLSDMAVYALILAGVLGGFAQICITASLRYAPLALLSPFDYGQILWAAAWAYLLFCEPITSAMLWGAALIVISGAISFHNGKIAALRPCAEPKLPPSHGV